MTFRTTTFRRRLPHRPAWAGIGRAKALSAALFAPLLLGTPLAAVEITLESPFLAGPGMERSTGKTVEAIQLSGITAIGSRNYACIADNARKSSRWLSAGGRWENIELISCDSQSNEAVVRVGGELRKLSLRKASTGKAPSQGPQLASAPRPPAPPPTAPQQQPPPPQPEVKQTAKTNEDKEREARMFVSDMLEISMKQRKSYEEARKKAEQEALQKKR